MISLYQIVKIFHLYGFILAIGMTVAGAIANRYLWRELRSTSPRVQTLFSLTRSIQIAGMVGMIVLLVAGIGMVSLAGGGFGSSLWFQIKMIILLLIFANGLTLGRFTSRGIKAAIDKVNAGIEVNTDSLRGKTNLFMTLQLTFFATIIILGIARFS